MGDGDAILARARREAAGDRNRALGRHVGHVRILAGRLHLSENEEGPIGFNFHRDGRLTNESVAQTRGNVGGEALRRAADLVHADDAGMLELGDGARLVTDRVRGPRADAHARAELAVAVGKGVAGVLGCAWAAVKIKQPTAYKLQ